MKLPFTADGIDDIAASDIGFQKVLSSLATADAKSINDILSDPSCLENLLQLLPELHRFQVLKILTDIYQVPEKALYLYKQCRYFEARQYLQKSITLYANPPALSLPGLDVSLGFVAKRVQSLCHNLLANTEWQLGNIEISSNHHRQAYKLAVEIGDDNTIAKALLGLGVYYWEKGDVQKAEETCLRALNYKDPGNDPWKTSSTILTTLSVIYGDIGQFGKALDYAGQAVDLAINTQDIKVIPTTLNNLAMCHAEHGNIAQAQSILEYALEIYPDGNGEGQKVLLLNNIAIILVQQTYNADAINVATAYLEKALMIGRDMLSLSSQAMTLANMGRLAELQENRDTARHFFQDSLAIYKHLGSRANEARVQTYLGKLFKEKFQDLNAASKAFQGAIETIEGIRASLHKETHRITYASREIDPYALLIECLVGLGKAEQAIEYVERAKSRALLDSLSHRLQEKSKDDLDSQVYQKAIKILTKLGEIQANLEKLAQKLGDEDTEGELSRHQNEELCRSLINELSDKELLFDEAYLEVTRSNPDKNDLLKVQTPSVAKMIQSLDDETMLVQLFQTDERLHVFIFGHAGQIATGSSSVSKKAAWEAVQGIVQALRQKKGINVRSHDFIREIRTPLAHLYQLLIEPIRQVARHCKRIIIVPHLFWHYLPFHCLYDKVNQQYLCDQFEIGYTPSASILQLCRTKCHHGRERALILCRNNGDLPHVDKEGDLIADAFSPEGKIFKGEKAHLGLLDEKQAVFDVIHIACHGRFIPEQPLLSGVDIPPNSVEYRQTYLLDFFSKRFDTNLTTLSACDTGLTNYTDADELIGLSRGLFAAGSASALLSLWQVADQSTCYFMENFYWHFVKNRQTKTRAAQLAMQAVKAKTEYSHPYFWGPFLVTGDWR
ncbi:MAG: CHAT domain-containing protein [Leadbetterella sp.]|nr:CHAT domain-containing protein [Leadbetterella sp.]